MICENCKGKMDKDEVYVTPAGYSAYLKTLGWYCPRCQYYEDAEE